ncbi:MAG TPA: hypothetical protein PLK94_01290 [Alphaproteobacteria bacterium]|nr:hypothetical protein [Alphaproteobacteria bacterium]HOO49902.1 hypothetical protein [Alphaproteobacteria bacterium]
MTYTSTKTASHTYSVADVEVVMRRLTADLVMIAQSTGTITEEKARQYSHDIEALATAGYLRKVDVTLMSGIVEIRATTYETNTEAGELTSSRPGGVRWPRMANAELRIVLFYNDSYTDDAREKMRDKLKIPWSPTSADTSHKSLSRSGGRDYASNAYGLRREDFGE